DGDLEVTRTVTVSMDGMVRYVDENASGASTGTALEPFTTLAAAIAASNADDVLFLYEGDYTGGAVLKAGQSLIGEPAGLVVGIGGTPTTVVAADSSAERPEISDASGVGVWLADGATVASVL